MYIDVFGQVVRIPDAATIGLRGNPCSRLRDRQSRQGSLLQLRLLVGVRIDASMAACIGQK